MAATPTIALISATPASIPPARSAFAAAFPEARLWNLLDDRLLDDAQDAGEVTPALVDRMHRLIDHATAGGADAVLLTCSLYGFVARERAERSAVPIHAPDTAALDAAVAAGHRRILVLASIPGALDDAQRRFTAHAHAAAASIEIDGALAPDAYRAALDEDAEALASALERACAARPGGTDAVLLAQYSLAPAADALARALGVPVYSGPGRAAALLRSRLLTREAAG
ncbi:aspartate/glutamate racemase family protein [Allonocardiopsis opalescens]|uniref:Asp/Glu/hydantoin racemase n=1 Tax=Allonocardiopsis opalescens TaxID=1144618 RepID=A0A2T0Q2N1_9ACTN|nr:aspartate/glutamate racemase family protein [Allonocardiopsis opalescens]PRX97928.1 hypothetical protein CLV72_105281 [Allonocardiopsis opalescens]